MTGKHVRLAVCLFVLFCLACQAPAEKRGQPSSAGPSWSDLETRLPPAAQGDFPFSLGESQGRYLIWGRGAGRSSFFFPEFLPALFERTLYFDKFEPGEMFAWIFTGSRGGFTVSVSEDSLRLDTRWYDSPGYGELAQGAARHPELNAHTGAVALPGDLRSLSVSLDHRLGLVVSANGKAVLSAVFTQDVSQHQLRMIGQGARSSGVMSIPDPVETTVRVDPAVRFQRMIGFGGIVTPTAYNQLSGPGKTLWWKLLREYNLLIQREYPIGSRLDPALDNWDRLEDATPHYYGDNFPNGEISDFEYLGKLRGIGGQVWFEFWALPPWVGEDMEKYAAAMVGYCRTLRERTGKPPEIVGVQNEVQQNAERFQEMTLALRRSLDQAGFGSVKIHMSDAGALDGGIGRARMFQQSAEVWDAVDYSASHMYDYQDFFTNPDSFDTRLLEWKKLTRDKPFLSTELCINRDRWQSDSYRIALVMGQLYHKNLTLADASAVLYCWLLLNTVQPSYGWTRSLFVPDRAHGFVPSASSCQLRVFGAFSRHVKSGMTRVAALGNDPDLLAAAFEGNGGGKTVVLLNRSTVARLVRLEWPGAGFASLETVDPYRENQVSAAPGTGSDGAVKLLVAPGALVTLSSAGMGKNDNQ